MAEQDEAKNAVEGTSEEATKKREAVEEEDEKDETSTEKTLEQEVLPSVDRPTRERKTVERFSSMSPQSVSATKVLSIKQGSGTKLKEIPNVFYKLSKRKADDNLKVLHSILFGQKAKSVLLKRNICQFSGFVWTENKEKERTKVKEKIDKLVKDKLLDFCDLLDIPVSKSTTKKEDVSAKLLDFLESPHVTRDVILSEKEDKKKRKRKKRSKPASDTKSGKKSDRDNKRAKKRESGKSEKEDSLGDDSVEENSVASEEDGGEDSETKQVTKTESKSKEDKLDDSSPPKDASPLKQKGKHISKKSPPQKKLSKTKQGKEKSVTALKKKAESGKGRSGTKNKEPTKLELDVAIRDILKEVDFNTATLADILKQLGTRFSMDLMHRKAEVKSIIEEVINDMTDDDDEAHE